MVDTIINKTTFTTAELKEKAQQEGIVKKGLKSFVEVGKALTLIQDKVLFSGSWENYLEETFSLSKGRAHRITNAAKMHEKLSSLKVEHLPANENVAATLQQKWGNESDERLLAVWELICSRRDGKPVTANLIIEVTGEINGQAKQGSEKKENSKVASESVEQEQEPEVEESGSGDKHLDQLYSMRATLYQLENREDIPEEIFNMLELLKMQIAELWKKVKRQRKIAA